MAIRIELFKNMSNISRLEWPCDQSVQFKAKYHQYTVNGQRIKNPSVTGLLKLMFTPFSAKQIITRKYVRFSKQKHIEIKNQWNNSATLGTLFHETVELFLGGHHVVPQQSIHKEFEMFIIFYNENLKNHIKKQRCEHVV